LKLRDEKGRIVIEPVREKNYDLTLLLDAITEENLHIALDFGKLAGKEVL
jgi:antitoxin MazE